MAVTIIATVGSASANSYVTLAEAQTILASRTDAADFLAESADIQRAHLIEAAEWLQRRSWKGTRVDVTQRLALPRRYLRKPDDPARTYFDDDAIPESVKQAQCELALGFFEQDDLESAGGDAITSFTAGRVSVQYEQGSGRVSSRYLTRTLQLLRGLLLAAQVERA